MISSGDLIPKPLKRQLVAKRNKDILTWLTYCATSCGILVALSWYHSEPALIKEVSETLLDKSRAYSYAVRTGGVKAIREIEPGVRVHRGEISPADGKDVALKNRHTIQHYWNLEHYQRLTKGDLIAEISPHHDSRTPTDNGFWVKLNQKDQTGSSIWIFTQDRLGDTEAWRLYFVLSLAGGTLIGTLIYLQRELIGPLHRAMAELPEASTLNINLIAEEGNGLARGVCEQMNRFLGHLNSSNASQRILLRGITHDLRGPLSRIKLRAEQLVEWDISMNELKEETDEMKLDIDQLCALTDRIYAYADTLTEEDSKRDLEISQALTQIKNSYNRNDIIIDSCREIIRTSPTGLQRSINNLIDNALEYGKPPVVITARSKARKLIISVEDHGTGLTALDTMVHPKIPKATDRHEMGHRGLGMGIVEQFCKTNGGSMQLSQSKLGGLRVEMTLATERI